MDIICLMILCTGRKLTKNKQIYTSISNADNFFAFKSVNNFAILCVYKTINNHEYQKEATMHIYI